MSERVLTDAEIRRAFLEDGSAIWTDAQALAACRAVEAAVLAKVRGAAAFTVTASDANRCISESACRRRERAAFDQGWNARGSIGSFGDCDTARDLVYPLPRVTRPREITLSTHHTYRFVGGLTWWEWRPEESKEWYSVPAPLLATAEDAAKVADVWAHPTEEVEA